MLQKDQRSRMNIYPWNLFFALGASLPHEERNERNIPALQLDPTRARTLRPAEKLCLAVLESTIDAYRKHKNREGAKPLEFLEAEDWLLSNDAEYAFSFRNVCEQLNISPSALRKKIFSDEELKKIKRRRY